MVSLAAATSHASKPINQPASAALNKVVSQELCVKLPRFVQMLLYVKNEVNLRNTKVSMQKLVLQKYCLHKQSPINEIAF